MVSLMSDVRVMFLFWFVGIAIVVASVLIFIEIRIRKKKERATVKRKEKTPVDVVRAILVKKDDVRKKLDIVAKIAKDYFKEEYGLSLRLDYSGLKKEFEKKKKVLEVKFCDEMFELYYSDKELTDDRVGKAGETLIEIYRKKSLSENMSRVPGFWDKVDRFLGEKWENVCSKVNEHISVHSEKEVRKVRVAEREEHEITKWVGKAIAMGYSKMNIFNLLNNGERSRGEVKGMLKVYDREIEKNAVKGEAGFYNEGGVAQKIVQRQKDRLEGEDVHGVEV